MGTNLYCTVGVRDEAGHLAHSRVVHLDRSLPGKAIHGPAIGDGPGRTIEWIVQRDKAASCVALKSRSTISRTSLLTNPRKAGLRTIRNGCRFEQESAIRIAGSRVANTATTAGATAGIQQSAKVGVVTDQLAGACEELPTLADLERPPRHI